jgi:hypothetical protein
MDLKIHTLGTDPSVPAYRILELINQQIEGGWFPRVLSCDLNGTAFDQGANKTAERNMVPVYDKVVIELDHADVGDTASVWFCLVEE